MSRSKYCTPIVLSMWYPLAPLLFDLFSHIDFYIIKFKLSYMLDPLSSKIFYLFIYLFSYYSECCKNVEGDSISLITLGVISKHIRGNVRSFHSLIY